MFEIIVDIVCTIVNAISITVTVIGIKQTTTKEKHQKSNRTVQS